MNRRATTSWKDLFFENGSYKLVALLVTLILWFTILGRRDFMQTKELDIDFLLPKAMRMAPMASSSRRVLVKVSGPRTALKKFSSSPGAITIDLTRDEVTQPNTVINTKISSKNIEVPFGVKVESIEPESIDVVLSPGESDGK